MRAGAALAIPAGRPNHASVLTNQLLKYENNTFFTTEPARAMILRENRRHRGAWFGGVFIASERYVLPVCCLLKSPFAGKNELFPPGIGSGNMERRGER